jgi:hypothetical protein
MKEYYQYDIEYTDKNGRYRHEYYCTCYDTYEEADEECCNAMSDLERQGCTEVQGNISESD